MLQNTVHVYEHEPVQEGRVLHVYCVVYFSKVGYTVSICSYLSLRSTNAYLDVAFLWNRVGKVICPSLTYALLFFLTPACKAIRYDQGIPISCCFLAHIWHPCVKKSSVVIDKSSFNSSSLMLLKSVSGLLSQDLIISVQ